MAAPYEYGNTIFQLFLSPFRKGGEGDLIDMGQLIESLSISLYPKGEVRVRMR